MTLRLNGATSGYTEIDAPAVAGSNTLVLPGGNGSDGNILGTDGAGNLSWVNGRMVLATAQNSTSGTSIDFTGIPSWVKRVTVMFDGVSTNGTSDIIIQLGTGATPTYTTSGYLGSALTQSGTTANFTTGLRVVNSNAGANLWHGNILICNFTGNTWSESAVLGNSNAAGTRVSAGSIPLAATLTAVRITTTGGTNTFDAGSINILYEG
jgi:hypothetical protein